MDDVADTAARVRRLRGSASAIEEIEVGLACECSDSQGDTFRILQRA